MGRKIVSDNQRRSTLRALFHELTTVHEKISRHDTPRVCEIWAGVQPADFALPDCIAAAVWMALRMRWYVPQRQMLPLMASSISASVGLAFLASSATADMICPD